MNKTARKSSSRHTCNLLRLTLTSLNIRAVTATKLLFISSRESCSPLHCIPATPNLMNHRYISVRGFILTPIFIFFPAPNAISKGSYPSCYVILQFSMLMYLAYNLYKPI